MGKDSPSIYAFQLSDAKPLRWPEAKGAAQVGGSVWLHLDRTSETAQAWMGRESGLPKLTVESLLASSSRPRFESIDQGILLTLRGVNLNTGADPADMISLRIWAEPTRVISLQREPLASIDSLGADLGSGRGPRSVGALVVAIIGRLTDRMGPIIDEIEDAIDEIEDEVIGPTERVDRDRLVGIRQRAIMLHRFLRPQATALTDLHHAKTGLFEESQRRELKEAINRVVRYVEDLDTAKSRTVVLQDELANQLAERMNQRIYTLTVILAVLAPLTILTGMLGMNVGGIPGSAHPLGFIIASAIMGAVGIVALLLAKLTRWL